MHHSTTLIPECTDMPESLMSDEDIPVIQLGGRDVLGFGDDDAHTVAYLRALAEAATTLADGVAARALFEATV